MSEKIKNNGGSLVKKLDQLIEIKKEESKALRKIIDSIDTNSNDKSKGQNQK